MKKLICLILFFFTVLLNSCYKSENNLNLLRKLTGRSALTGLEGDQALIDNFELFLDNFDPADSDGDLGLDCNGEYISLNGQSKLINQISINSNQHIINNISSQANIPSGFTKGFQNSYFGSILNFELSNQTSQYNTSLYIPNNFSVINPTSNITAVSKSTGFNIDWTVDPNPLNNKGVAIEIFYSIQQEKIYNSNVTGENIVRTFLVPDNGHFVVTPQILINFPPCNSLLISVAKGNYTSVLLSNSKNLPIFYKQKYQIGLKLTN
ncbi:MAG: hypothetical protein IT267_04430 [Saprospiraceae bacterium]|nr:hypothetical protein [Saprospiraceae bacterium]